MRRYYVQTVDEQTGEPAYMGCVEEESMPDALQEALRQAIFFTGHPKVRVTRIAEQGTAAFAAVVRNLTAEGWAA